MPRVSVLMVAYNAGRFLRPAVLSILEQTHRDLELVFVDNASTDGSVDELFASISDPRIHRITRADNGGPATGAIEGLPSCSGEFIARMDADDISHRRRLEIQLAHLEVDPSLDAVGTGFILIDEEGHRTAEVPHPLMGEPEAVRVHANVAMPFIHASICARRAVFEKTPYRDVFTISDDYDFALRLVERFRLGNVPLPLYRWRRHPQSTSVGRRNEQQAWMCGMRLIAARRRRGEAEDVPGVIRTIHDVIAQTSDKGSVYSAFSRIFESAGELALAAHHLRIALEQGPRPRDVLAYARLCRRLALRPDDLKSLAVRVAGAPVRALERPLTDFEDA